MAESSGSAGDVPQVQSTHARPRLALIVAVDQENGIGKDGTLPWSLRPDMDRFVRETKAVRQTGKRNVVIMGRRVWDSIPERRRPLAGRLNIVLSRSLPAARSDDLIVTDDYDAIMKELTEGALSTEVDTIWNIGGADLYRMALGVVDEALVTRIDHRFDCDVFLAPDRDWTSQFHEAKIEDEAGDEEGWRKDEASGLRYRFQQYVRLQSA